jgi:FdhD protein
MPSDRHLPAGCATRPVIRVERGQTSEDDDRLAEEVPVAMHFNGEPFAVMMCTPDHLDDFARGFALTEGQITTLDDITHIEIAEVLEGITLNLTTTSAVGARPARDILSRDAPTRNLPGRSGCGICGSRELEDVVRHPDPVGPGPHITAQTIELALESLRTAQPINAFTGSVHAAAWALPDGTLITAREDVGRHNALDKLIGALLAARIDTSNGFVVLTSRASYEMVTKAAVAGITIVVAISAPTALAVHLAADCGVTLIGFARPGRFNIYTRPQRII